MNIYYNFEQYKNDSIYRYSFKSDDFNIIDYNKIMLLDCSRNYLIELPILPNSLIKLYCSNNRLLNLPILPDCLEELYCYNNKLIYLPILPKYLKALVC